MKAFIIGALILPVLLLFGLPVATPAQTNNPGALSFDGVSGFVQMPSGVWFSNDFTIEGWVYVRSYQNWSRLIDFSDGPNTNNVYLALTSGTGGLPTIGVFTNDYNGPFFSSTSTLPINQWVHLAETAHGTNGTIYINGNIVGTGTLNIAPNVVRSNNYVGRSAYPADSYADAIFDELRIWNTARNQFQLQTFMSQPLLGPQTNLVGYWQFNDNTGTQASDSSGNNHPGTLQGGVTWTNFTAPISPGFGTALNFDGTNQVVTIPNQPAFNTLPLTIMTWFKAPTNSVEGSLVNKYISSSNNGYMIYLGGGHLVAWYVLDDADYLSSTLDAGPVNDGQWHHAAFVVDTNGGKMYLDGVLKATNTWFGTPRPTTTTQGLSLGNYPGEAYWNGQLDEVSLWNAPLSLAQIRSAALQGLTGMESNLLAYYRLDEGGGTFTADSSTNHFNGTLTSSNQWVASFPPLTYSAQTISATPLSTTSELLIGGVIPVGLDTTAWFQFGTSTNYGSVTASTNWTDGFLPQRIVSTVLTGLLPNTDYHYQLVCSNSAGIRTGADQVFHSLQNIFVTSLADSGAGSLRQALATAHNLDTIYLTNGTILLTSGELAVPNTVSIVGISPSATAISGNNASRIFNISPGANVSLSFITIENGRAPTNNLNGGGIYNLGTLTIDHCVLLNNQAGSPLGFEALNNGATGGNGGGIWNGGTLFLSRSTLLNNSGGTGGAGGEGYLVNFDGPPIDGVSGDDEIVNDGYQAGVGGNGGGGGAIMNSGTATVSECTFIGNATGAGGAGGATSGGQAGSGGNGGEGGAVFNKGTLTVIASTLIQNTVGRGGPAGTVIGFDFDVAALTYTNGGSSIEGALATISAVSSSALPGPDGLIGGIANDNGSSATLRDTVVAQNSTNGLGDIAGAFNSAGHNFIGLNGTFGGVQLSTGLTNGINGDLVGSNAAPLDPQLMLLVSSGGVTPTCELLPGSPLKDAGDDSLLNPPYSLTTDQRDLPRLVGAHVDIGAVESSFSSPTAVTLPVTPTQDSGHVSWHALLEGSVNPGGLQTTVYFQYGASTNYDFSVAAGVLSSANNGNNLVSAAITNLSNDLAYHYRVVASNSLGIFAGNDMLFQTLSSPLAPGDINGDGIVDASDLAILISHLNTNGVVLPADVDLILSNYFSNASALGMTNVTGLGTPVVIFGLTNYLGENFSVEYSSNLIDWVPLGRTSPLFQFTDTNAPAGQRYYRLRWP